MKRRAAFVVALACVLAACASPSPQRHNRAPAPAPVGDAYKLAAAALRTWAAERNTAQALTLIEQAAEQAPDNADIAWLHLRLCVQAPGCEPPPLETRLRELDPGNGVVWLSVLSRAQARGDERSAQSILETMGRAGRYDLYWTTLVSRLTSAMDLAADAGTKSNAQQSSPASAPLTEALNEVIGWLSRLATPAFDPVVSACDPKRAQDARVRASCQRIADAMQRSDTTLVEGLGLGIAQRFAAPGSAAASTLDERVATLAYQSQAAGGIVRAQVERDKFSAQMLELMKKVRREQDVSIAILRWAGRPLTPEK